MFMLNLRHSLAGYKLLKTVGLRYGQFERSLIKESVSLVYFLSPNPLALDLVDTPMITTVWDLGHRDIPEFVEISGDRHYEEREFFYRQTIPKSFRVIVDTDRTAERIQAIYGVLENRIIVQGLGVVQPAVPKRMNGTGSQFFLYPAQFWPHKNHVNLIDAFKLSTVIEPDLKLLLVGSDRGTLKEIRRLVNDLGLDSNVKFLGTISNDELENLYQTASLMIFPSFFGPDNLPPLEAISFQCPVAATDHPGSREQFKNGIPLFDPTNIAQMSQVILDRRSLQISLDFQKKMLDSSGIDSFFGSVEQHLNQFAKIARNFNS
jgi:glycosyltransferase involved in cell wall biosynthesis